MRGEKSSDKNFPPECVGSPPLARGKAFRTSYAASKIRITPACAGKSTCKYSPLHTSQDHPRLRGEKYDIPVDGALVKGITPACAGKSFNQNGKSSSYTDHPRLRGEKTKSGSFLRLAIGSPPLARGKEGKLATIWSLMGITPACAGKSLCHQSSLVRRGDHPRLRGEKTKRIP